MEGRQTLFAITNELGRVNDRLVRTNGVGSKADSAELDTIEQKLTRWQIDHALDSPLGGARTPLQRLADAAFDLASTLGLVILDNGAGSWNSEWNDSIAKFNAAVDAVP